MRTGEWYRGCTEGGPEGRQDFFPLKYRSSGDRTGLNIKKLKKAFFCRFGADGWWSRDARNQFFPRNRPVFVKLRPLFCPCFQWVSSLTALGWEFFAFFFVEDRPAPTAPPRPTCTPSGPASPGRARGTGTP